MSRCRCRGPGGWSRDSEESEEHGGQTRQKQATQDLVGHVGDVRLYPNGCGKSLLCLKSVSAAVSSREQTDTFQRGIWRRHRFGLRGWEWASGVSVGQPGGSLSDRKW